MIGKNCDDRLYSRSELLRGRKESARRDGQDSFMGLNDYLRLEWRQQQAARPDLEISGIPRARIVRPCLFDPLCLPRELPDRFRHLHLLAR